MNVSFVKKTETDVEADSDERQRVCLNKLSVKSAQAIEAPRRVLTHEAAEEIQ